MEDRTEMDGAARVVDGEALLDGETGTVIGIVPLAGEGLVDAEGGLREADGRLGELRIADLGLRIIGRRGTIG